MASPRQLRRFTRQAQQEATARYGPQQSALAALLAQAAGDMQGEIASGTSAARGVGAAARAAIPVTRQAFSDLNARQENSFGGLSAQLQGLSGTADPFKGAALNEQALARSELAREAASTQNELTQRQVDAEAQRAQTIQNAHAHYSQTAQKLADQLSALSGQAGAFTSSTIQSLEQQAARDALTRRGQNITQSNATAGRAVTRRGQDLSHQDRVASRNAAAKKAAAKGKSGINPRTGRPVAGLGSLTQLQENAARDAIQQARSVIRTYGKSLTSGQIRAGLAQGGLTDANGKRLPLPKVATDYINAAYDLEKNGALSPLNERRLHARGVHVPTAWRPGSGRRQQQSILGAINLPGLSGPSANLGG